MCGPSPSGFGEVLLTEALREKGITVEGTGGFGFERPPHTPELLLAEHVSPPLKDEIKVTLKVSQNLHASITPLILGAMLAPKNTDRTGVDLGHDFLVKPGLAVAGAPP